MTDRTELLEAALDSVPDGFAVMGADGNLAFWNRAASAITGHAAADLVGRPARGALEMLIVGGTREWTRETGSEPDPGRGSLVRMRHRLGHELPVLAHTLVLRDGLGQRLGAAVLFHPAERIDALPHGDCSDHAMAESSQAEIEERLEAEFDDCSRGHLPFGILWITIDQAHDLRRTHGARACEAMLEKVAHVLSGGLRPGEEASRWGDDEFLVISHERTVEMLAAHAQSMAGLTRTADFRWWGDRITLTASVGAAQAEDSDALPDLLARARSAMRSSIQAGGNQATISPGRLACSPS